MRYVIGCDVGGTRLKYVALSEAGKPLLKGVTRSDADRGPEDLVNALSAIAVKTEAEIGESPAALAFGISGAVDPKRGVVMLPGKFANLEGYPLVPTLRRKLRMPVVAENDGRISIIAEKPLRSRSHEEMGCMSDHRDGRRLRRHARRTNSARSISAIRHTTRTYRSAGRRGAALHYGSARNRRDSLLGHGTRNAGSRWFAGGIPSVLTQAYLADPQSVDFAAVIEGVRRQDTLCVDELNRWTEHLGWLLISAAHAYAPEVIILSGGAMQSADCFLAISNGRLTVTFTAIRGKSRCRLLCREWVNSPALWEPARSPGKPHSA